jgi:hypothetical protein
VKYMWARVRMGLIAPAVAEARQARAVS